jgi:plasmid stabilization system protein ParE
MSRTEFSHAVAADLERIARHLHEHDSAHADSRAAEILAAIDVLHGNPRIGCPVGEGWRELVIGRRNGGYLALYRYIADLDIVVVLAIRAQREAGYTQT